MDTEDLVGQQVPELSLPDTDGHPYPLRRHVGRAPLVVFFIIRNGTPG